MPRVAGVDIPNDKPIRIALRYILGIGPSSAEEICTKVDLDPQIRAKDLTEEQLSKIASVLDSDYIIEGSLRRQVQQNIARLRDINCYRGLRHRRSLPVRGQRTKTNARTKRGPRRTVPGRGKRRGMRKK